MMNAKSIPSLRGLSRILTVVVVLGALYYGVWAITAAVRILGGWEDSPIGVIVMLAICSAYFAVVIPLLSRLRLGRPWRWL